MDLAKICHAKVLLCFPWLYGELSALQMAKMLCSRRCRISETKIGLIKYKQLLDIGTL